MKKMNKKGFTLIEMLAVIAIIAVLVAIIVPAVGSSTTKAKAATDAANLRSVLSAATIEYASNGLDDDDKLALDVTVSPAKSVDAKNIVIVLSNSELIAYYTDGQKYYKIDDFAAVAEGRKDSNKKVIDTVTNHGSVDTTKDKIVFQSTNE